MANIKIVPLGGVREIGKNMHTVEVNEEIFILDVGLAYPEGDQIGVDYVIPDFTYIEQNKKKVAGIFLSNGQQDAIGALPYLLDKVKAPVFGSKLTLDLARLAIENSGLKIKFDDFHEIDDQVEVEFNSATVSFFKTTHTIPDSYAINIHTEDGVIVYTGDFKFDQSNILHYETDLSKIVEVGNQGVLALLSDSINAESQHENETEAKVEEELYTDIANSEERVIVASVNSNILRIQQIFHAAHRARRRIYIESEESNQILKIVMDNGKFDMPSEDILVDQETAKKLRDDNLLVLVADTPNRLLQKLNLMAQGRADINFRENDLVYFVTSPSPAMEVEMTDIQNDIYRSNAVVKTINEKVTATGHATPKELKLMINLLKPQNLIPVHGDYAMLADHASLGHQTGLPYENTFILSNGDVLKYEKGRFRLSETVVAGDTLVDGIGVGDIGNIVLRDRRVLAEDGVFIAVVTINRKKKKIVSGPKMVTRGFVFVKESRDLLDEASDIVRDTTLDVLQNQKFDWNVLKQEIRENLGKFLFKKTSRKPIILPIIMEAR